MLRYHYMFIPPKNWELPIFANPPFRCLSHCATWTSSVQSPRGRPGSSHHPQHPSASRYQRLPPAPLPWICLRGFQKNKKSSLNRFPSHGGFPIGKINNHRLNKTQLPLPSFQASAQSPHGANSGGR